MYVLRTESLRTSALTCCYMLADKAKSLAYCIKQQHQDKLVYGAVASMLQVHCSCNMTDDFALSETTHDQVCNVS